MRRAIFDDDGYVVCPLCGEMAVHMTDGRVDRREQECSVTLNLECDGCGFAWNAVIFSELREGSRYWFTLSMMSPR
jgi:C4-type Zn-finger protein